MEDVNNFKVNWGITVPTVCVRCWSWWSCWVPVVENLVQSHHRCALLGFHQKVHPCLIWTILTMILLVYNIYNSDNRQWKGYLTINYVQFIYGLFSPKIKSPWGAHRTSPSFRITHQLHPGPWVKAILRTGRTSPVGGSSGVNQPGDLC